MASHADMCFDANSVITITKSLIDAHFSCRPAAQHILISLRQSTTSYEWLHNLVREQQQQQKHHVEHVNAGAFDLWLTTSYIFFLTIYGFIG